MADRVGGHLNHGEHMPAKPLPSDRELLLRLLDEAGQVLTGLEPVCAFVSARKEIRKLPPDPDGLRKISPLDLQLIKGRYEAALNRLTQTSEPIPHGIGFLSPFLELPKEPQEYMKWLHSFDFPLDQCEHIASKIILLRQQIAEKLADDSRTGHEYAPEAPEVSRTANEAAPVARPEELTPPARAIAAAYDLQKEGKPVSLRAACDKAKVDRANLRRRYPDAVKAIEALSEADRAPRRGVWDRRTGDVDGWDSDDDD